MDKPVESHAQDLFTITSTVHVWGVVWTVQAVWWARETNSRAPGSVATSVEFFEDYEQSSEAGAQRRSVVFHVKHRPRGSGVS